MINLAWMILANAAVLLGSRALLARFGTGRPAADVVLFLLYRLVLISVTVLFAGALHALRPWVLGLAGSLALALLIRAGTPARFLPLWKIPRCAGVYLLLALLLRLLLQTWFLSPFLGDVTSYHLPKVAEWVTRGTIFADVGPDPRAWWPAGFELVEAWWVLFLHHDVLIELAGLEFLALGAASTAAIASRLGLSLPSSLLAAAVFATAPGMMVPSVFAINDPAAASLVVATAALILEQAPPALILTAVGLGLGVKPTFGFTLPGLLLLWYALRRTEPAPLPSLGRSAWGLAALALVMGGVWYARNTVQFENPFYPAGTEAMAFGERMQNEVTGPRLSRLSRNLSDLLNHRILDSRRAANGMLDQIAGWGAGCFAFGLMGLIAVCRSSRRWVLLSTCLGVSLVSVLSIAENDPWVMRYILFVPALLAVAAAALASEIKVLTFPLVLLTALNIVGTVFTEDLPVSAFARVTKSSWKDRSMASEFIPDQPFKRVGCYGDISSMAYLLYGPDLSREVVYLRPKTADDLIRAMDEHQLTALYASTKYERNGWERILQECVKSGRLRLIEGPWYRRAAN